MVNGSWKNWALHAGVSIALSLAFSPVVAIFGFWMKEAGEKSKQLETRSLNLIRATISDYNPMSFRWNNDDRMDLVSAVIPALILLLLI